MIKLRPHHILCVNFYKNSGYSEEFIKKMDRLTGALAAKPGQTVEIVKGGDDICNFCPNYDGSCSAGEKPERYDNAVLKKLNLVCGEKKWRELTELARQKIINAGKLHEICGDCEWFGICGGSEIK